MRKPLIAGNWKMNGTRASVNALVTALTQGITQNFPAEVAILPPFVFIPEVQALLKNSPILLGAQNLYLGVSGAFTGEVSGVMLADYQCRYVLVGHSERRQIFHEDLKTVAAKFKAAQAAGLTPILCIGETLNEREQGVTEKVIQQQLQSVIEEAGIEAFKKAVIAYEPVWAIGTGKTATPEEAQAVHAFIRQAISKQSVDVADSLRILYGGSMKADNAVGLLAKPDIDGGLIGGASLNAADFLTICTAAKQ